MIADPRSQATTNSHARDGLAEYAGTVVDAGRLITSEGPSSGIDLGLHLVERFLGSAAAAAHADAMDHTRPSRTWYAAR